MRSARNLFRFQLGLAGVGLAALLTAFVQLSRHITLGTPSAGAMTDACRWLLPMLSPATIVIAGVFTLVAVGTWRAARSVIQRAQATRSALRRLPVAEQARLDGSVVDIFLHPHPRAFCAGLLRPRVYVSSAAVRELEPAELAAVVAHEAHHARRRDPLRLLALEALASALFFMPVLRHARDRYGELAEVAADEAAVRRVGSPQPLASALLRFEEAEDGTVGLASERVDHLLGEPIRWQLPAMLIALGLAAAAAVAVIGALAAAEAPSTGFQADVLLSQACAASMLAPPGLAIAWVVTTARRSFRRR